MTTGDGKRGAYNAQPLSAIQFQDASGNSAVYTLNPSYCGQTLLSIVQSCMGTDRSNTGTSVWNQGHCTKAGSRFSRNGIPAAKQLRIGVGDGQSDSQDWALFMLKWGNAGGDFTGNDIWAIGGEMATNNGYTGTVYIYGEPIGL